MASLWISPLALPDVPSVPAPAGPPARSPHRRAVSPTAVPARGARRAADRRDRPALRVVESVPGPSASTLARRRLAAVAVLTGMAVAGWHGVAAVGSLVVQSPATQFGDAPAGPVVVREARAGDTLWSMAERFGPGGDVRRSIDQLARLNGGNSIVVGQAVRLPAGWFTPVAP